MKTALVFAHYPDNSIEEFGKLDEVSALKIFDEFPWSALAQQASEIMLVKGTSMDADLTFIIGDVHMMTRVRDDAVTFQIEACVKRDRKILGIIDYPKFYEIESVPAREARSAIKAFFDKSDADKHVYFSELAQRHKKIK